MDSLRPIKLLPARERVASALRKAIMTQELKKGEEISLESIAERLQVSSTPVREAYQMLAREGLIKLRPNKGAIVLGISEKWIREHFELRAILEREAVMMVCRKNVDLSSILNVDARSQEVLKYQTWQDYADCNQSFHMEIWTAAGNEKLKELLSSLWNGLSMGYRVTEEEYARLSIGEHQEIVAALVAKDGQKAGQLMEAHILRSMESILTHLNPGE
ncbi:MAG: GntR family transcriptional regulator [Sphaerochaetaceae bacterium]|nr:GntR family transcriptional regulator [Sphaerochaetaceae bacterium]